MGVSFRAAALGSNGLTVVSRRSGTPGGSRLRCLVLGGTLAKYGCFP